MNTLFKGRTSGRRHKQLFQMAPLATPWAGGKHDQEDECSFGEDHAESITVKSSRKGKPLRYFCNSGRSNVARMQISDEPPSARMLPCGSTISDRPPYS